MKICDKNQLIQSSKLVNARYNLSTNAQKIVIHAISQVAKDDSLNEYSLKFKDILPNFNGNYTHVEKLCDILNNESIHIDLGENHFYKTHWFAGIEYKDGEMHYTIDKKLKPYLLELQRYVKYDAKYISLMSSSYAIRIYQLILEYKKIGKRVFKISELQQKLQVPQSLLAYGQFKRKVLQIAERDINKHTDINVGILETKKEGKKVLEITFIINKKNTFKSSQERIDMFLKMCNIDTVETEDVRNVLVRHFDLEDEIITSNILYVNESDCKNYAAYLTKALESDFAQMDRLIMAMNNEQSTEMFKKHDEEPS